MFNNNPINRENALPDTIGGAFMSAVGNDPTKGIKVTTPPPTQKSDEVRDLTEAEKAALADKQLAERNKEKGLTTVPGGETTQPTETDEEIQAKLDAISQKEDKDLTPEDKAYIEKYTAPDEVTTVKNLFQEKYGLEFDNRKYENNPQGLITLVDEVAPVIGRQMLEDHFESYPALAGLYDHVVNRGLSIDTFMAKSVKPAFETIELKQVDPSGDENINKQLVNNQKELVRLDLASRGVDDVTIAEVIDLAETSGNLYTKATKAMSALKAAHQANVEAMLKEEEAQIAADEQERQETANQVLKMIEKNDFNGRSIPPADLKLLQEAEFKVDNNGRTLLDYKRAKLSLADRIFLDYIILKDFKITNYTKSPEQTKVFSFKKAKEDNESRGGGRLRGAGNNGSNFVVPKVNVQDFLKT